MLITLEMAKQQLCIGDDLDNDKVSMLIPQAIGLVVADVGRDIYQSNADVPESAEAPIILDGLSPYQLSNLQTAVLLQLGSLWVNTEADTTKNASETPAYKTAIKPFRRTLVG
ncbi:head-tail connector protein [Pseudoalteromonas sp. S16_S37]|uniref:head-tail connector protein n=1 Tax=Pseudoalteromonas sp. S16_S37 TaxID=2720228 RepID=UPI0016802659|nr:head-tail connector protein [Pseudoalteromonas sp. S16_S37]MBD1583495.1 phage gp6-like head-tail connector protein [Pseudoalteromonas sp. S16_S37]